jgi:FHS family L-fucose permease-like MFS transporter
MNKDRIVPKQYIIPFILITSLFALWGFANDITNPMVAAFKKVMEISNFKASLVQFAFYGGYFTMALPAAIFIKKYSYKSGILIGLILYAIGAFLFFPAAKLQVFGFFLVAYYILTFGLAFLETTSNPFILSMGPDDTATRRLNLAQSFNPVGSLSGMIVAQMFILQFLKSDDANFSQLPDPQKAVIRTHDLEVIRDPYIILGFVVLAMFIVIALYKMPKEQNNNNKLRIMDSFKRLFHIPRYYTGVVAQAFYVGAQIMCWTFIFHYAENIGISNATAVYYNMVAMGVFLLGRFIFTYLLKYINSGRLLMILAFAGMVFTLGAIFIQNIWGLYSLVMISFCMSLMFPTIYGIALRGLGDDAKFGSAGLVMAIVGGALLPPLQGKLIDSGGIGLNDVSILGVPEVNFSFILPFFCFIVISVYGYLSYRYYLKDAK